MNRIVRSLIHVMNVNTKEDCLVFILLLQKLEDNENTNTNNNDLLSSKESKTN